MNRALPPLALLAILLLAAAPAQAHVETFSQSKTVAAGPYTVFIQPRPDVVYANTTVTISAQVADNTTGAIARHLAATLLVGGPDNFTKRTEMRSDGSYLLGITALPSPGTYSFRILLKEEDGTTYNADTEMEAYPDLPVRIRSANAVEDTFVGEPASLTFQVVNATSLQPTESLADLRMRLEHWSDDHSAMLGATEVDLTHEGRGVWRLNHTFPERGMYHLKFASQAGGFTYDDVPILHTYASNPPPTGAEQDPPQREVPMPGLLGVLAAMGVLLALRRR